MVARLPKALAASRVRRWLVRRGLLGSLAFPFGVSPRRPATMTVTDEWAM